VKALTGESYCIVNRLERVLAGGVQILNDQECPLMMITQRFQVMPSCHILGSVSMIHQCGNSCFEVKYFETRIEREAINTTSINSIKHDNSNTFYCINLYCINYHTIQLP